MITNTPKITKPSPKVNNLTAEKLNDNASSTAFIDQYQHQLRYVYTWRKWLWFDGRRWSLAEGDTSALRLSRKHAEKYFTTAKKMRRAGSQSAGLVGKFALSANGKQRIQAVVDLATADERTTISHNKLDADKYALNLLNGTLDLNDCTLRPHAPGDLLTQIAGVEYQPDADCPEWREMLQHVFAGDDGLIRYVQTLLGYSLAGTNDEHILPIGFGDGCNGKSTIWNTWHAIMGDFGGAVSAELLMPRRDAHPTEVADLFGKRFVAVGEPDSSAKIAESKVKDLTGDRVLKARRMREDFWEFQATHTFWLSTNHKPEILGTDEGIWRRVKLIPFAVNLKDVTTIDPKFAERLKAEYSGILNWALEGWKRYQREGLIDCQAVIDATADYRESEDRVGQFIEETFQTNPQFIVGVSEAFDAYQASGGILTKTQFGSEMSKRFTKSKPAVGKYRNKFVYQGIGLAPTR